MAITIKNRPVKLTPDELAALRRAVESDKPAFASRMDQPPTISLIEQPFFAKHHIYDVSSPMPFPAQRIHAAGLPDGSFRVLTGKLANLVALAEAEPPAGLGDPEAVRVYANLGDFWTNDNDFGDLRITSFSEIPWRKALTDLESALINRLRESLARDIGPMRVEQTIDGPDIRFWVVANRRLIHRVIHVPPDGKLRRRDDVHAADLPVHPGRLWGMVNGRLVPTG